MDARAAGRRGSHSYEIAANWKLIHENYQECYHCSEIHPALCKVTPPDSGYSIDLHGLFVAGPMDLRDDVETMSLDGRSGGVPIPGLTGNQLREVGYFGVFPNLLISPHPDYVLTHRIEPLAPDRSFIECEWLFPPEAWDRPGFDPAYAVDFWDITNREDWAACESLQRSAASRGYRPGPLSTAWEAGPYLQTRMIALGYQEGAVTRWPERPKQAERPGTNSCAAHERSVGLVRPGRGVLRRDPRHGPDALRTIVDLLAAVMPGRGPVIELGVGTGQIALPLAAAAWMSPASTFRPR